MSQRHTIAIKDNHFVPNTLHVRIGDQVVWDNQDGERHTVTCVAGPLSFDTGDIAGNSSSRAVTFAKGSGPSGLGYFCAHHELMMGRIFVQPAGFALTERATPAPGVLDVAPSPTYDIATWQLIAKHVAAHWVMNMASNFAFALSIHLDAELDQVKTAWAQIETDWQTKTGTTKKIINKPEDFPKTAGIDPSAFDTRTRAEIEGLGRQIRLAYAKLLPRVFRYPAPARPDAVLHADQGELYEGQSNDPFGEAITVNFVDKAIRDAEVRHEAYGGALMMVEISIDAGRPVSDPRKAAYLAARQALTLDDFHLLAGHLFAGLSEFFGSDQFAEDKFAEGIRRMTVRGEWDGDAYFPLWHWLRWIDGYVTVKTTNQLPDPVGLA